MNTYGYVYQSPLNYTDPDGLNGRGIFNAYKYAPVTIGKEKIKEVKACHNNAVKENAPYCWTVCMTKAEVEGLIQQKPITSGAERAAAKHSNEAKVLVKNMVKKIDTIGRIQNVFDCYAVCVSY